jgi:replicative DNA helicase
MADMDGRQAGEPGSIRVATLAGSPPGEGDTMSADDVPDDELGVCAGLMDLFDRDLDAARDIVAALPVEAFTSESGDLYAAVKAVVETIDRPARIDVGVRLQRQGHDENSPALHRLKDAVKDKYYTGASPYMVARLAREAAGRVRERHEKRLMVEAAKRVIASGASPEDTADFARVLERAKTTTATRQTVSLVQAADDWARHETTPRVATGFPWTDLPMRGGLPVGGLVALVAPPGVGKTAIALQWTIGALLRDRSLRAVWAAGELTPAALAGRGAVVASGLLDDCRLVTMDEADRRLPEARQAMVAFVGAIGDRFSILPPPLTVEAIEAAVVATGAKLVVIDYLQLLRGPDAGRDRVADLDGIVGRVRELSITRECAVVVVSSMAKATGKDSRAGQLGRGSGEIDYAVELLYLGEIEEHGGEPVIGPDGTKGVVWRCRKARNLEPRDLVTRFDGATQTYHDGRIDADFPAMPLDDFAAFAPGPGVPR